MRYVLLFFLALLGFVFNARAALPSYRLSSGSATTNLDTTGAKLIVIQCNSFGAACHTSTFADSASNTYTCGSDHPNSNYHIKWCWVINPTTSSTQNWTASSSDTIYISVYGAPSGGTAWLADSAATGYDTSVNNSVNITALTLTPTVTGDIIIAGLTDNVAATGQACTISTGTTNAAPIVFTLSTCTSTNNYIYAEPFVVTSVNPSAYNGNYTLTAASGATMTADNGSPPGSAYVSGGTVTGSTRWIGTPSGSCQFTKENEFNTASKQTGINADTVACASTSAQVISGVMTSGTYSISAIAFKPVLSGATKVRHAVSTQ
jgi:hypothetical protein